MSVIHIFASFGGLCHWLARRQTLQNTFCAMGHYVLQQINSYDNDIIVYIKVLLRMTEFLVIFSLPLAINYIILDCYKLKLSLIS